MLMVFGSPHFALPGLAAVFSPALNASTTTNKLRAIAGGALVAASPLQVAQLVQQSVVQPGSSRVALVPVAAVADFVETLPPSSHCSSLLAELDGLEASHTRLHQLGTSPLAPAAMDLSAVATLQLHTNMGSIPTLQHPPAWKTAQYGIKVGSQALGHLQLWPLHWGQPHCCVLLLMLHAGDHACMTTAGCWLRGLGAGNNPSCAAVCRPASTCQTCPSSVPSSSSIWSPRGMAVQQGGSAHPPAISRPPTSVASWALSGGCWGTNTRACW